MTRLGPSPRIRRSPFYDSVVADGVTDFTVYNKMLLPTSFGDLDAEYERLIHGVAMWDVAAQRQVQLDGKGAGALAQYLTARDLTGMAAGQGKYVAMCDGGGRLLNDPVLLKLSEDRYWFSLADADMLLWVKAVAAENDFDVDVSEPDVSPLAVQGPLATDLVANLLGDWVRDLRYFWFRRTEIGGIPLVVCRSGWSKQGGYEFFLTDSVHGNDLYAIVKEAGRPYGIGPGAPNHIERVESGLLSWGADTTPDSNPFEAGMGRFVEVDIEPDYIGKAALQEIAAVGPQRLLTGLVIDGDPPSRWPLAQRVPVLAEGRPVGSASAIVRSPRLGRTIGIAQVQRELVEAAGAVEVEYPGGRLPASFHELPFI